MNRHPPRTTRTTVVGGILTAYNQAVLELIMGQPDLIRGRGDGPPPRSAPSKYGGTGWLLAFLAAARNFAEYKNYIFLAAPHHQAVRAVRSVLSLAAVTRRVGGWDSLPAGRGVTGGKGEGKLEGSGFLSLHTSQAKLAIDNRISRGQSLRVAPT